MRHLNETGIPKDKLTKPKILVLFCGGTIVMEKDSQTGSLNIGKGVTTLLNLEPRIGEIADVIIEYITDIDSTNATPELWDTLIKKISDNYGNYDGFVVTHGTNTMGYTSSAPIVWFSWNWQTSSLDRCTNSCRKIR